MDLKSDEALAYLDALISNALGKGAFSFKEKDLRSFCVTPEEIENYINDSSSLRSNTSFASPVFLTGLELLGQIFGLTELEQQILLIISAPEIEAKYERIYAYLQDDLNRKYASIALICNLLANNSKQKLRILSCFLNNAPLLEFKLIKIEKTDAERSWISEPLRLEPSVRNFLLGQYFLEEEISRFCQIFSPIANKEISNDIKDVAENLIREINKDRKIVLNIIGKSEDENNKYAQKITSCLGYGLLKVDSTLLSKTDIPENETLKTVFREALLSGSVVYFSRLDLLYEEGESTAKLLFDLAERLSWMIIISSEDSYISDKITENFSFLKVRTKELSPKDKLILWHKNLNKLGIAEVENLSKRLTHIFNLSSSEIEKVCHLINNNKILEPTITENVIYDFCRRRTIIKQLDRLAKKVDFSFEWEDIVLSEDNIEHLKEIVTCLNYLYHVFEDWGFKKLIPKQGMVALFMGPSGTGKTMAASIIAHELNLELYRIDLSQVVSKYVGETEKNLAKIFNVAEGAGVILFFDEADALFGKRTEVKDAHNRYANMEVSYLLQRIEEYNGLVILATNFRRNIDEAFVRRIHFIIEFPFPDEKMREKIWEKIFPKETPLDEEIDFKYLAKNFKLSGGNIRNVALRASFYAAEEKKKVGMEHILRGIKRELQKMGKTFKT